MRPRTSFLFFWKRSCWLPWSSGKTYAFLFLHTRPLFLQNTFIGHLSLSSKHHACFQGLNFNINRRSFHFIFVTFFSIYFLIFFLVDELFVLLLDSLLVLRKMFGWRDFFLFDGFGKAEDDWSNFVLNNVSSFLNVFGFWAMGGSRSIGVTNIACRCILQSLSFKKANIINYWIICITNVSNRPTHWLLGTTKLAFV